MFEVADHNQNNWQSVDITSMMVNMRAFVQQVTNKDHHNAVMQVNQFVRDMQAGKVVHCGNFDWRWQNDQTG